MATFGSFAGLATGAMGALSSTELELLSLCDFSAVAASQKTSSKAGRESQRQQDSSQCLHGPAQRTGLLSHFNVGKLAPEFNGIGCFDTVFGWQSS
eukprot:c18006_g1_i1 orf=121-408(+)